MAKFVKGDVVVVPFPFSDLSNSKRRPALVINPVSMDDLILCQITSQSVKDEDAITLELQDFKENSLEKISNVRPNKLFTADSHIVLYKIASLKREKMDNVIAKITEIIQR